MRLAVICLPLPFNFVPLWKLPASTIIHFHFLSDLSVGDTTTEKFVIFIRIDNQEKEDRQTVLEYFCLENIILFGLSLITVFFHTIIRPKMRLSHPASHWLQSWHTQQLFKICVEIFWHCIKINIMFPGMMLFFRLINHLRVSPLYIFMLRIVKAASSSSLHSYAKKTLLPNFLQHLAIPITTPQFMCQEHSYSANHASMS